MNLELITYAYLLLFIALMAGHILLFMPPMAGHRHDHIIINSQIRHSKTLSLLFMSLLISWCVPSIHHNSDLADSCQLNNSKFSNVNSVLLQIFLLLTILYGKTGCWFFPLWSLKISINWVSYLQLSSKMICLWIYMRYIVTFINFNSIFSKCY